MTEETEVQEPAQEQLEASQDTQDHIREVTEKVQEPVKTQSEINWERAADALRQQKQEIEDLKQRLHKAELPPPIIEKDEFEELDPDDYMTVAKAKSLRDRARKDAAKDAQEAAKKYVQEYAQQQAVQSDEQRMRGKHEDYDYVVENFTIPLIKSDPALAYRIQQSKNPAETAYKLGKISDSYEEQTMKQQDSKKAEKVLKNASRPTSGNAAAAPLKSQADKFSNMSKEDIWAQSQKYAKSY